MHVSEDGAFGAEARNPVQRLIKREMARMPAPPQRVHDPHIQPLQQWQALLGQVMQIAGIGKIAKPEAERLDRAVELQEWYDGDRAARPVDPDGLPRLDGMASDDR